MSKVIFIRHAESVWNRDGRYTGWTDVDLTQKGVAGANEIGHMLRVYGDKIDIAYTSMLKRAIRTLWIVLWEIDRMWIPVHRSWRLNERHYGNLQGQVKTEVRQRVGEEQFWIWRRSYATAPPALPEGDPRHPSNEEKYKDVPANLLPSTESLADTLARAWVFWLGEIVPNLKDGKNILISAHGNSIRALVKQLNRIDDEAISRVEIPLARPLIFEFDENAQVIDSYFLENDGAQIRDIFHFSDR